jgi:sec-independent protein translocase protein TatA
MTPLITLPGGWELILILAVIVMFFGAAKLPELARGMGQSLKIFKDETKGLREDDDAQAEGQRDPGPAGELGSGHSGDPYRQGEQRNDGTTA